MINYVSIPFSAVQKYDIHIFICTTTHIVAKSLPKNRCLVFHHLEGQRTSYNIHFDRNVHRVDTFNLKKVCHAKLCNNVMTFKNALQRPPLFSCKIDAA